MAINQLFSNLTVIYSTTQQCDGNIENNDIKESVRELSKCLYAVQKLIFYSEKHHEMLKLKHRIEC